MPSKPDGTNSEVFLLALPALTRAVEKDEALKLTYFVLIRYWMAFTEERSAARHKRPNRLFYPGEEAVKKLLHAARLATETPTEDAALEMIIMRGAIGFAPTEWMLGAL
jgi:hypothetical protein